MVGIAVVKLLALIAAVLLIGGFVFLVLPVGLAYALLSDAGASRAGTRESQPA